MTELRVHWVSQELNCLCVQLCDERFAHFRTSVTDLHHRGHREHRGLAKSWSTRFTCRTFWRRRICVVVVGPRAKLNQNLCVLGVLCGSAPVCRSRPNAMIPLAEWQKALQLVGLGMTGQFSDRFNCHLRARKTRLREGLNKCLLKRGR